MKLFFDARVMQIFQTGVSKSSLFLYDALLKLKPEIEIRGIHQKAVKGALPRKISFTKKGTFFSNKHWQEKILPKIVEKERPDFIHFPWSGNIPAKKLNARVIMTLHDVLPLEIPGYLRNNFEREKYISQKQLDIDRTDILLTDSEYSKKQIIKNFNLKKDPSVLYFGTTIKPVNIPPESKNNYFLYVGGYDKRKGLDTLLEVYLELFKKNKIKSQLVLTGNPHYFSENFKKNIQEAHDLGFLKETGYISDETLATLFQNALALIYPSKYEGFGLPPLEAMSLGCPVITTQYTSIPEICGDAVLYADPDNHIDFSQSILKIEEDQNLRNILSEKGLKQASLFSWEKTAKQFIDIIWNQ